LSMQVKLLRVIQEKRVRPVGSTRETPIDVRIISATHQNLTRRVEEGLFRQDLYYRLNVIELNMPALRDRPTDIPELTRHLLENIAGNYQQPVPKIEREALDTLKNYSFPGNVRELENILERAFTMCEENLIRREDLGELSGISSTTCGPPQGGHRSPGENLEDYLARVEREVLQEALEASRWNKTAAAKQLGISFRSLRYRLSKLGFDSGEEA
ncbi:MAG TPA: sigma-54-dependent Fis family transcriptional regulator, partial [Chromatiaceae bacterium]|nr:sigma-54-dependent Fis family transcriptional regulator [Chromatiaceae bacterium]